jgi:hypothetical protein
VWRRNFDELARCDDFGSLPKLRKVLAVTGNQVVRTSGIGTFDKYIVIGIVGYIQTPIGSDEETAGSNQLQKPKAIAPANANCGASEHLGVFIEDGLGNIKAGRSGDGNQEGNSWKALLLKRRRNDDIGIDNQAQR